MNQELAIRALKTHVVGLFPGATCRVRKELKEVGAYKRVKQLSSLEGK